LVEQRPATIGYNQISKGSEHQTEVTQSHNTDLVVSYLTST